MFVKFSTITFPVLLVHWCERHTPCKRTLERFTVKPVSTGYYACLTKLVNLSDTNTAVLIEIVGSYNGS